MLGFLQNLRYSQESYALQLNLYIFKSEQGVDCLPIPYRNYHCRFARNWVLKKFHDWSSNWIFLFHWNNGQNSESDIFIVLSWIHTTFSTFIQLCFQEWKNNNKQITQTYTFTQAPSIFGYTSQLTICVFVVCVRSVHAIIVIFICCQIEQRSFSSFLRSFQLISFAKCQKTKQNSIKTG